MKTLFVVKMGTTFPDTARQFGDFDLWTCQGLGLEAGRVEVIDIPAGDGLPAVRQCAGVVVTGSHAMVTDRAPWSETVAAWIPSLVEAAVPFLGICYGHQLLAHAMGGTVGFLPAGMEIGTVPVRLLPEAATDRLFGNLPQSFQAHATHAQTILSLPPGAVRLAANHNESTHAFRVGESAWGVQFHPEYSPDVMTSYIRNQSETLRASGSDPRRLLDTVRETPQACGLLAAFARLAETRPDGR